MNIKTAKDYYELGILTGFDAVKDIEPGRWILCISGQEGRYWILETALGKPKSFASLDTLVGEVAEITGRVTSLTINAM